MNATEPMILKKYQKWRFPRADHNMALEPKLESSDHWNKLSHFPHFFCDVWLLKLKGRLTKADMFSGVKHPLIMAAEH